MARKRTKPEQWSRCCGRLKWLCQRQDDAASVQGSGGHGAELLPVAEGVRGLKLNQARRLKELEKENARLKRVVADYGAP